MKFKRIKEEINDLQILANENNLNTKGKYLLEELEQALRICRVGVSLPSNQEIDSQVLDIIDKNLQCGTGDTEGIICNRFAAASFIRDYIKKLVAH